MLRHGSASLPLKLLWVKKKVRPMNDSLQRVRRHGASGPLREFS